MLPLLSKGSTSSGRFVPNAANITRDRGYHNPLNVFLTVLARCAVSKISALTFSLKET